MDSFHRGIRADHLFKEHWSQTQGKDDLDQNEADIDFFTHLHAKPQNAVYEYCSPFNGLGQSTASDDSKSDSSDVGSCGLQKTSSELGDRKKYLYIEHWIQSSSRSENHNESFFSNVLQARGNENSEHHRFLKERGRNSGRPKKLYSNDSSRERSRINSESCFQRQVVDFFSYNLACTNMYDLP